MPPRASQGWTSVWHGPESFLLDVSASGERLVARIRLAVTLVLLASPILAIADNPGNLEHFIGLLVVLAAVAFSGMLLWMVERELYRPWLGFATAAVDVSIVSLALVMYLLAGRPHIAVNSLVVYPAYFIALAATCLRYDARICIMAGLLAMLQYSGIIVVAMTWGDLNAPEHAPFVFGMVRWVDQASRLVLLAVMTGLVTAVVMRWLA